MQFTPTVGDVLGEPSPTAITVLNPGGTATGVTFYGELPIFDIADNAYAASGYIGGLGYTPPGGQVNEIGTAAPFVEFASSTPVDLVLDSSGNIYGATVNSSGGVNGPFSAPVSLFKISATSQSLTTLYSFPASSASNSFGNLTSDAAGNLYWLSGNSLFELPAGSGTPDTLATFNSMNSANASIYCDHSGNIFMLAPDGAPNQDGAISEIASGKSQLTTVVTFDGSDGTSPMGLIFDKSNNLYGVTASGGAFGVGTAFKISAGTNSISTLVDFSLISGASPSLGLYADGSGNLYGATSVGGPNEQGTIFKITGSGFDSGPQASGEISGRVTFASSSAQMVPAPDVTVFIDSNGNGNFGPGDPEATTDASGDYSFSGLFLGTYKVEISGVLPADPLSGAVTTSVGLQQTTGVNFSIRQLGIADIATFDQANETLNGTLAVDSAGDLFGSTTGGQDSVGTLVEVPAGTSKLETVATFYASNGGNPTGSLYADTNGIIYGTATSEVANTVFSFAKGTLATLVTFANYNVPYVSGVVADAGGNLFGAYGSEIFEITAGDHVMKILATEPSAVAGSLAISSDGNIFMVDQIGNVYELPAGATAVKLIASNLNLQLTLTGVAIDLAGNLYLPGYGDVVKIAADTHAVSYISLPTGVAGAVGVPVVDAAGNVFVTAQDDFALPETAGPWGVYEIPTNSNQAVTLVTFPGADGELPAGNLVSDAKGDLFGITSSTAGGASTIFEVKQSSFVPFSK